MYVNNNIYLSEFRSTVITYNAHVMKLEGLFLN